MKKIPYWKISNRRTYTFKEISLTLGVHVRTVQIWRKEGLPVLDPNNRPLLSPGNQLKTFLRERSKSKKTKLATFEFYCLKCRVPVLAYKGSIDLFIGDRSIGKNGDFQVLIKARCSICQNPIRRFSTTKRMVSIQEFYKSFGEIDSSSFPIRRMEKE